MEDEITFTCINCGVRLLALRQHIGYKGQCPECSKIQEIESEEGFESIDAAYLRLYLKALSVSWDEVVEETGSSPVKIELVDESFLEERQKGSIRKSLFLISLFLILFVFTSLTLRSTFEYHKVDLNLPQIDSFLKNTALKPTQKPAFEILPQDLVLLMEEISQKGVKEIEEGRIKLTLENTVKSRIFYQESVHLKGYDMAVRTWKEYTDLNVPDESIKIFVTSHDILNQDIGGLAVRPNLVFIKSETIRYKLSSGMFYAQIVTCHEIIHIFCYNYLGESNLPKWFMEGIAVYLSEDTGDPGERIESNSDLFGLRTIKLYSLKTVDEYMDYRDVMHVIRRRYGDDLFKAFITRVLKYRSVDLWAKATGFKNQDEFYENNLRYAKNRTSVKNWPSWARWTLAFMAGACLAGLATYILIRV